MRSGKETVYFIEDAIRGQIKIGKSDKPRHRLSQLQVKHGLHLKIIGVTTKAKESELHSLLESFRLDGEWFRDCDAVRETIIPLIEETRLSHIAGGVVIAAHVNDIIGEAFRNYMDGLEIKGTTAQHIEIALREYLQKRNAWKDD